jgi:predicted membrane-bound spermidine synthase
VVGIFSLAIFLVLVLTREFTFPDFLIKTFLYISMPLFGMICGLQFSFVIKLQKSGKIKVASSSYAIDLIGAAGGAILAVSLLIPVLGIPFTILLLVGLNLFVVVLLWFKKRAL